MRARAAAGDLFGMMSSVFGLLDLKGAKWEVFHFCDETWWMTRQGEYASPSRMAAGQALGSSRVARHRSGFVLIHGHPCISQRSGRDGVPFDTTPRIAEIRRAVLNEVYFKLQRNSDISWSSPHLVHIDQLELTLG